MMRRSMAPHAAAITTAKHDVERAQRTLEAITIQTVRFARMLADEAGERVPVRELADVLGVSKSQVSRIANGKVSGADYSDLETSVQAVWDQVEPAMQGWVARDPKFSYEVMGAHGIAKDERLGLKNPDAPALELEELASGARWILYAQTRWDGLRDEKGKPDHRGQYRIESCPGLSAECWRAHTPVSLENLGLSEIDLRYGRGWSDDRPGDSEVYERLREAMVNQTGALELGFFRTVVLPDIFPG